MSAGLQVSLARLDGTTNRVTGVSSTRTDASGRHTDPVPDFRPLSSPSVSGTRD